MDQPTDQRLLVVSPVRNEAAHLERVVAAMAAQTRPPDEWVVVDDGSDDGTAELLASLARRPVPSCGSSRPQDRLDPAEVDRLALAAAPRAFNAGLAHGRGDFTHVAKLDGDVELPPDYYEVLLTRFAADPRLGIACGDLIEPIGGRWERLAIPPPPRPWRPQALLARVPERDRRRSGAAWLGHDRRDLRADAEFHTRSFPIWWGATTARWPPPSGALRGRARHGRCAWIAHFGLGWVLLRGVKVGVKMRPRGISGLAFVYGYLQAAVKRVPRVEDREFRRFVRHELRGRMRTAIAGSRLALAMCGIAGVGGSDPRRTPLAPEVLAAMTAAIEHRGPDEDGHFLEPGVALGMRRLSVIDPAGSPQPVASEDGEVTAVFNGEIYNFRELREELRGRGHRFATDGDGETIVHLYEELGPRFVERLRGMFAIALWDRRRRRLVLARDRMGVKPLYVAETGAGLAFGSEVKSLVAAGLVRPQLDPAAAELFMAWGYVPGPLTLFAGVRKLDPASYLVYADGKVVEELSTGTRWDSPRLASAPPGRRTASACWELLRTATRARMVSDVPLGVMLSGGLDSSLITALMAEVSERPVQTFSVGFVEDAAANELDDARRVAQRLGTDHHELETSAPSTTPTCSTTPCAIWRSRSPISPASACCCSAGWPGRTSPWRSRARGPTSCSAAIASTRLPRRPICCAGYRRPVGPSPSLPRLGAPESARARGLRALSTRIRSSGCWR